jgi:hypothetical protein
VITGAIFVFFSGYIIIRTTIIGITVVTTTIVAVISSTITIPVGAISISPAVSVMGPSPGTVAPSVIGREERIISHVNAGTIEKWVIVVPIHIGEEWVVVSKGNVVMMKSADA